MSEKKMNNYFAYWKRGWWALGLIISINIILGVGYAGLAFLLQPLLENPFPVAVAITWMWLARLSRACSSRSLPAGQSE
jgi:hypothetical protein